jgi:hypothetical protein
VSYRTLNKGQTGLTHNSRIARKRQRGQLAVITGLVALPLCMVVAMSVELVALSSERARMQAAVDVAALAGASQLAVSGNLANASFDYAENFALQQLQDLSPRLKMKFVAQQDESGGFVVDAIGSRDSFFGNLVPPGGFIIRVKAIAETLSQQPLCILSLQNNHSGVSIEAKSTSAIRAQNCLIHANGEIQTRQNGTIQAGSIQSTGTATGVGFAPAAHSGALQVPDPFKDRSIPRAAACSAQGSQFVKLYGPRGNFTLLPGVHREKIVVSGISALSLIRGQHTFCAGLTVQGNSRLFGDDVVLIFDDGSLVAKDNVSIRLSGRETGPWAGFVVVSRRENDDDMKISSSQVDQLLGTIYLPGSDLIIDAVSAVAEASSWSVVVAKSVITDKNGGLTINSDYVGSGVPVPVGVGNSDAAQKLGARLKQ